jgi:hypothetical protein
MFKIFILVCLVNFYVPDEILKAKDYFEDLILDARTMLKYIVKQVDC